MSNGILTFEHYFFLTGEILKNNNGRYYKILEVMSQDKILLEDIKNKNLCIAYGTRMFRKVFPDGKIEDVIEWAYSR